MLHASRWWLRLSCCLLLAGWSAAGPRRPGEGPNPLGVTNEEWGSGGSFLFQEHLLRGGFFPADGPPLVMETPGGGEPPANCTERFWLPSPSSSSVCEESVAAGAEEFQRSRLMVLQNRAALQAVSTSRSYKHFVFIFLLECFSNIYIIRSHLNSDRVKMEPNGQVYLVIYGYI